MEAEFTKVGPGQSLRLVYQVMGQNGPISNPTNIRYIPAGTADAVSAASAPVAPLSALTAYAQLANVGLGLANIGLTAAVLVEARKQTRMLRELQADVKEIRADLKVLLDTTQRIDVNVAQGHLREGLRHAARSATRGDEVDLVVLARLVDQALNLFYPSIGGPVSVGCGRALVLASDVRELAESAMHLLFAARRTALEAHNLGCAGDPVRVVRDDRVQSIFDQVAETTALLVTIDEKATEVGKEVRKHLHQSWRFVGDTDWYRHLVEREFTERLVEHSGYIREAPTAKALMAELSNDQPLNDARTEGPTAVARTLSAYFDAWVGQTDAGLLWRLAQEVSLQQDREYWSEIDPWSTSEAMDASGNRAIVRDVMLSPSLGR